MKQVSLLWSGCCLLFIAALCLYGLSKAGETPATKIHALEQEVESLRARAEILEMRFEEAHLATPKSLEAQRDDLSTADNSCMPKIEQ